MKENKNKSKLPFDAGIRIEVAGRRIFVKMPKREADVQFVRSFRFAYWDAGAYLWVIPILVGMQKTDGGRFCIPIRLLPGQR